MFIIIDKSTKEIKGLYNDFMWVDENLYELKEVSFEELFGKMTYQDNKIIKDNIN